MSDVVPQARSVTPSPPRIFISYSHEEEPLGLVLKRLLEDAIDGASTFLSSVDLPLGAKWLDTLESELAQASHVVLVCSEASVERPWVNFEAGAVFTSDRRVIPVCHSGLRWADLPDRFGRYQGIDLSGPDPVAQLVRKLGGSITSASADQFWSKIADAVDAISYGPRRPSLPEPPDPRFAVLIDERHGQDWAGPVMHPESIAAVADAEPRWTFHRIPAGDGIFPDLDGWRSMILTLPHGVHLRDDTIDHLVRWVRDGARLAVFGFELGDHHHDANLNALLEHFGVRMNTDIVGRPDSVDASGKPYGRTITFDRVVTPTTIDADGVAHDDPSPLLAGVAVVRWSNIQTIAFEPGGTELIEVGANRVGRLHRSSIKGYKDGLFRAGSQRFEFVDSPRATVAGLAPETLTESGEVLVVGTWQLLPSVAEDRADSARFLLNVLRWLTSVP